MEYILYILQSLTWGRNAGDRIPTNFLFFFLIDMDRIFKLGTIPLILHKCDALVYIVHVFIYSV